MEVFEVGEQADFLEHLRRKILRFVDDQHGALTGLIALEEPLVQLHQHLAFLARFTGDAEVRHHEIEKLRDVQARVEHEGGKHALLVQPFEQLVDQRGFPGPHFAGKQDESLAGLDAIGQAGQRFLRVRRQVQVARGPG